MKNDSRERQSLRRKGNKRDQKIAKEKKKRNQNRSKDIPEKGQTITEEVKENEKSASLSKKSKKADESGLRISKNFVTSEPSGSDRIREMGEKSCWSNEVPPLFGERNILRARVIILEKVANG